MKHTHIIWILALTAICLAQVLVSKGADVNAEADVNAKDNDGNTPLCLAIEGKVSIKTVKALVAQGAVVNVKDNVGQTPLDTAKERRNVAVAEYLGSLP